jgi:hypothetical protein
MNNISWEQKLQSETELCRRYSRKYPFRSNAYLSFIEKDPIERQVSILTDESAYFQPLKVFFETYTSEQKEEIGYRYKYILGARNLFIAFYNDSKIPQYSIPELNVDDRIFNVLKKYLQHSHPAYEHYDIEIVFISGKLNLNESTLIVTNTVTTVQGYYFEIMCSSWPIKKLLTINESGTRVRNYDLKGPQKLHKGGFSPPK